MNPYQIVLTCDVCGRRGMGTRREADAAWLQTTTIAHRDPRVCRMNLDAERERLARAKRAADREALLAAPRHSPLDLHAERRRLAELGERIERARTLLGSR